MVSFNSIFTVALVALSGASALALPPLPSPIAHGAVSQSTNHSTSANHTHTVVTKKTQVVRIPIHVKGSYGKKGVYDIGNGLKYTASASTKVDFTTFATSTTTVTSSSTTTDTSTATTPVTISTTVTSTSATSTVSAS